MTEMNGSVPANEHYSLYNELAKEVKNNIRGFLYSTLKLNRGSQTYSATKLKYDDKLRDLKRMLVGKYSVLAAAQSCWVVTFLIKDRMQQDRKRDVEAAKKYAKKNAEGRNADDEAGPAVVSNPESRPSTHTRDEEPLTSSVPIPQPSYKISVTPSALVVDHEDNPEPDDNQDSQKMTDVHSPPALHFHTTNGQKRGMKAPRKRGKRFSRKRVKRSQNE
ncbi:hypothetical protein BWQ96_08474 [Gracilariopsis chorda]|uniref:Uncharacterized protein n=1 Tax=Gracilariopsis chorda TaxID=448386 RepID=A0A2V3II88_9FLOR|nr:hypothetical protein BWQ96_08474 [Gracilariopsis chorda]|eukprot:PXF41797.1 hypothetical protein BWQ96_08474 [Gracilariopsis chorda]